MKVKFTHYLHDDKESWYDAITDALPVDMSNDEVEAVRQRAAMPFYEVKFELELDTDTGEVKILKSNL